MDGTVSASGERSPTTPMANPPATKTAAASIHNNPSSNPTATAAAPSGGPTNIPTRRVPSCQVSNITALSGPQRSPVSASNALRPGLASASPNPSNNPLTTSTPACSTPSTTANGTIANATA